MGYFPKAENVLLAMDDALGNEPIDSSEVVNEEEVDVTDA